jgi:hypothetical protein
MPQPFLARFLRGARTAQDDTQLPNTQPAAPPSTASFDGARELIRMAMRSVRASAGIPKDWISVDVLVLDRGYRQRLELQIVVRHWDARLFAHSQALERALQAEIARLDPNALASIRRIGWRFSSESDRPDGAWPPAGVEWVARTGAAAAPDLLDGLVAQGLLPRPQFDSYSSAQVGAPSSVHPSARAFMPTQPLAPPSSSDMAFAPTQPAVRVRAA